MDLDKHLKAVLGWLYSANQEDKNVRNAMDILTHVIKELHKKGIKDV